MAYRSPPSSRGASSAPARPLPKPPMSRAAYWTSYVVVFYVPLFASIALLALGASAPLAADRGGMILAAALVLLAVSVAMIAHRAYAKRLGVKWTEANTRGVRLLGEGEAAKAAATFDELLAKSYWFPVAYSLYLWNRGVASTRMGELDDARAILLGVERASWFDRPKFRHFVPSVAISLGLVEALAGDVAAADSWRQRAHAKLTSASSVAGLPLDVLLAARKGKVDDAEALCQSQWTAAEAALTARDMKLLRVLRAFVASRRAPDDRAAIDAWLAGAKPMPAGMFDYVGARWPEFAAFAQAEL